MTEWISIDERFPDEGQRVQIRRNSLKKVEIKTIWRGGAFYTQDGEYSPCFIPQQVLEWRAMTEPDRSTDAEDADERRSRKMKAYWAKRKGETQ